MSKLTDNTLLPGKTAKLTASGAIVAGKPVILNSTGTVTQVTQTVYSEAIPAGTEDKATSASYAYHCGADFDPTSKNIVACYSDHDNSTYGYVVVGEVSGTTLTWGTPTVYYSGSQKVSSSHVIFDPNTEGSFVIVFQKDSNDRNTIIASTLSGTTIGTFGSAQEIQTHSQNSPYLANNVLEFDPNTAGKFAVINSTSNNEVSVKFGTVSGTTVSMYSGEAVFYSEYSPFANVIWNPHVTNEIIVSWIKFGWWAKVKRGTLTGNDTVSWGTEVSMHSGHQDYFNIQFDPNTSGLWAWVHSENATNTRAGTLSGDTWTQGTLTTIDSNENSAKGMNMRFDPNQARTLVVFKHASNGTNYVGSCNVGSISGTTISWDSAEELTDEGDSQGAGQQAHVIRFHPTDKGKFVCVYALGATSGYELAGVVCQLAASETNLTATNFLGIADEDIANTATGSISIKGGLATEGLNGLTPGTAYYLQESGAISTTSTSPAVKLGKALSSTALNLEYRS